MKNNYWEESFKNASRFIWYVIHELYDGITNNKINVVRYCYPGLAVAAFFALRIDSAIAWVFDASWMSVPIGLRQYLVYVSLSYGLLFWAFERALQRSKVLSRLRSAFLYCGLKANEKLPSFIEDAPIDDHVRKLKILGNGVPLKKFQENRESLEAHLNISVIRMYEEPDDKTRINIVYAMKGLPDIVHMETPAAYIDGEIPIGCAYEGAVHVNLRDMGHLLVAGQTGGGKSNFLKIAASTLSINNPESEVYFLDFKGGMEIQDLLNKLGDERKNFFHYADPGPCIDQLIAAGKSIETRFSDIAKVGASTFDEYKKKMIKQADQGHDAKREDLKRTYYIVDEIAQLYNREPSVSKEKLALAREAVNRIARQGRASGMHLIVATQKPDATSFDQTVKANLPAILCFPMPNQAASVAAVGSKRAFELNPEIPGRAVYKFGPELCEVQTFAFH